SAVQGEGLGCEQLLLLAGEEDGARVTQNAVVCPGPVEPFFRVLQREAAFEPRVEHPMRKDKVRRISSVKSAPRAKAVILPEAVDDDGVITGAVLAQPG